MANNFSTDQFLIFNFVKKYLVKPVKTFPSKLKKNGFERSINKSLIVGCLKAGEEFLFIYF